MSVNTEDRQERVDEKEIALLWDNFQYKQLFNLYYSAACNGSQIARLYVGPLILLCLYEYDSLSEIEAPRMTGEEFIIKPEYLDNVAKWINEMDDFPEAKDQLERLLNMRLNERTKDCTKDTEKNFAGRAESSKPDILKVRLSGFAKPQPDLQAI